MRHIPPFAVLFVTMLLIVLPVKAALIDGIDVSHWQGDIQWGQVHGSGVEFAFIKATESTDFVDSKFQFNMDNSQAAGVVSGPYHFARPDTSLNDAASEAMHFATTIRPYYELGGYLRPVIDLEVRPGGSTASDRAFLSQWIRDFAATIQSELGFAPLIYTNVNFATNYLEPDIADLDLWIARWTYDTASPPDDLGVWSEWAFWQYSNQGSVSGIAGRVDLDVFDDTGHQLSDFVAPPLVGVVLGDGSNDGKIDGIDYLVWAQYYGDDPAEDPPGSPQNGDYNEDGKVDGLDYLVWANNFGQGPNDTVVIPEPATFFLAALTLLVLLPLARRK